jgi:hypothetical protein
VKLTLEPEDVQAIAKAVVAELAAGSTPEHLDQHASPLGSRRHIAAIRSGKLAGVQVGRRWLARREDVTAYVATLTKPQRAGSAEADLAAELGISLEH